MAMRECSSGGLSGLPGPASPSDVFLTTTSVSCDCHVTQGRRVNPTEGYEWFTYAEVGEMRDAIGSSMEHLGLLPREKQVGDSRALRTVGIFSANRWEWSVVEHACNAYGGVPVGLYDSLDTSTAARIIGDSKVRTVFAPADKLTQLIEAKREHSDVCPQFENLVLLDSESSSATPMPPHSDTSKSGLRVMWFASLLESGRANLQPHRPPGPDDVATICHTPHALKAVRLTHRNVTAAASGFLLQTAAEEGYFLVGEEDIYYSRFPMAHVMERTIQTAMVMMGACVGFPSGEPAAFTTDLRQLRPTVFLSIPYLSRLLHAKVLAHVARVPWLVRSLFRKGYASHRAQLSSEKHPSEFWDSILFRKLRTSLGMDRLKLIVMGAGPTPASAMEFFQVTFRCPVVEHYAMVESAWGCTMAGGYGVSHLPRGGNWGGSPLPCTDVKLVSVEELGYRVSDEVHCRPLSETAGDAPVVPCLGRGEICIRGSSLCGTDAAVDGDGWYHTGDIGFFDERGGLHVIGRKESTLTLRGQRVTVEHVESVYLENRNVAHIFVHEHPTQNTLAAVVVPRGDDASESGLSVEEICANPADLLEELHQTAVDGGLHGREVLEDSNVRFTAEAFTVSNGLLTPMFRLNRTQLHERFVRQTIDERVGVPSAPSDEARAGGGGSADAGSATAKKASLEFAL